MHHLIEQASDIIQANDVTISICIEESITALVRAAENIKDDYLVSFYEVSGKNGNKRGSRMPSVRSRKSEGGTTIEIRWMRVAKVDDQVHRKSYSKGTGFGYSVGRLTKGAPEWEVELVRKTEEQFTTIRKLYTNLARLRKQKSALMQSVKSV